MYSVSTAIQNALASGAEQRVPLRFAGRDFTNEDIDVDVGLSLRETFNPNEDVSVGQCTSAEIAFRLFNDNGYLSDFEFGEFSAWIGVELNRTDTTAADSLTMTNGTMTCVRRGVQQTFGCIPLGVFIAPRPDVVRKFAIDITANDRMTLFDVDMPSTSDLGITYPITAGALLQAMCTYVGVTAASYSFLNSGVSLASEPKAFESLTMREVLSQIAELAGSTARFNRSGVLEFVWFNSVNLTLDEHNYTDFQPAWYQTPAITALHVRNENSTREEVVGSGDSEYMIQNNVFLRVAD